MTADRRQDLEVHSALPAAADNLFDLRSASRRYGDQNALNLVETNNGRNAFGRSQNLAAVNADAVLGVIVVDETDRAHAEFRVSPHLPSDGATGTPGADDQHVAFVHAMLKSLCVCAHREPAAGDEKHCQRQIDNQHRSRVAIDVEGKFEENVECGGTDQRGLADVEGVAQTHVAPPSSEQSEEIKHQQLDGKNHGQGLQNQNPVGHFQTEVEPQKKTGEVTEGYQSRLRQKDQRLSVIQESAQRGAPGAFRNQVL